LSDDRVQEKQNALGIGLDPQRRAATTGLTEIVRDPFGECVAHAQRTSRTR
jgi:hypothetical protein